MSDPETAADRAPVTGGTVPLTVRTDGDGAEGATTLAVPRGANLRATLLAEGFDVYGPLSRRLNCGGRGLCATCGVCIADGAPAPDHWHDRLAVVFGYPRLSCQVTVDRPMTVALVDKLYWGQALPRRFDPGAERSDAGTCASVAGPRDDETREPE